jgi:hypothetical protein
MPGAAPEHGNPLANASGFFLLGSYAKVTAHLRAQDVEVSDTQGRPGPEQRAE